MAVERAQIIYEHIVQGAEEAEAKNKKAFASASASSKVSKVSAEEAATSIAIQADAQEIARKRLLGFAQSIRDTIPEQFRLAEAQYLGAGRTREQADQLLRADGLNVDAAQATADYAKSIEKVAFSSNLSSNSIKGLATALHTSGAATDEQYQYLLNTSGALEKANKESKALTSSFKGMGHRTLEESKNLYKLQSVAHGTMLGMGVLNRNIQQVGFSLIFLRFSSPPIVAASAAIAAGIGLISAATGEMLGTIKQAAVTASQARFIMESVLSTNDVDRLISRGTQLGFSIQEISVAASSLVRSGLSKNLEALTPRLEEIYDLSRATGKSTADLTELYIQAYRMHSVEAVRQLRLLRNTKDLTNQAEKYMGTVAGDEAKSVAEILLAQASAGEKLAPVYKNLNDLSVIWFKGMRQGVEDNIDKLPTLSEKLGLIEKGVYDMGSAFGAVGVGSVSAIEKIIEAAKKLDNVVMDSRILAETGKPYQGKMVEPVRRYLPTGVSIEEATVNAEKTRAFAVESEALFKSLNLPKEQIESNLTKILAGIVPGFQSGGVVPGPKGAPRLILAHGGESVSPSGSPVINISISGNTLLDTNSMSQLADRVSNEVAKRVKSITRTGYQMAR